MHKASSGLLIAGVVLVASGAAQAQQATPFIDRISTIAQPCYSSKSAAKATAETCVKALATINGLRSQQTKVTPHEQNMYLANSVFVTTALSRLYTELDAGRTARVCVAAELSWKSAAQIVDAASPDYAVKLKAMRDSLVPGVTKCREDMGAPAGAPPLPGASIGPPAAKKPLAAKPRP